MGYINRPNSSIVDFEPDDTDTEMYIACDGVSWTLQELMEKINAKWPNHKPDEIEIKAEYIHTQCLYYDRYDSGDYTKYLHISYNPLQTLEAATPEEGWTITSLALAMRAVVPDLNPMTLRDNMVSRYYFKEPIDTNAKIDSFNFERAMALYRLRHVEPQ